MELLNSLVVIMGIFVTLIILDFIWLGIITKDFIISQLGGLVRVENGAIKLNIYAGLLVWFLISVGIFLFVVNPYDSLPKVALMGVIFGFVMYGVYDLTNLTYINNYPLRLTFVDIVWGSILCGIVSTVGFYIKNLFV